MMRSVAIVAAALIIPVGVAGGQGDPRLRDFDPTLRARVLAVIDSARDAGLPVEPLVDVALMGRSRGATPDAIVQVVRGRAAKLESARTLLGRAADVEIIAAWGALEAGLAPEKVLELRRRRPDADLTTPLGLLEQMLLKGISKDTAANVMLRLTIAGMDDRSLSELWSTVERDIAIGMLPSASLAARAESLAGLNNFASPTSDRSGTGNAPTGAPPPPRPIPPARP